jgi:hypothetical protein
LRNGHKKYVQKSKPRNLFGKIRRALGNLRNFFGALYMTPYMQRQYFKCRFVIFHLERNCNNLHDRALLSLWIVLLCEYLSLYHIQYTNMHAYAKTRRCRPPPATNLRYPKALYAFSSPRQAQKMARKYLGASARLYPASNPVKKYRICDPKLNQWVNFGQMGYEDYTRHKNKTRRKNYLTRTAGMLGNWKRNKYSANNLSRNILW